MAVPYGTAICVFASDLLSRSPPVKPAAARLASFLGGSEVDRRIFAASVYLKVKLIAFAFADTGQT